MKNYVVSIFKHFIEQFVSIYVLFVSFRSVPFGAFIEEGHSKNIQSNSVVNCFSIIHDKITNRAHEFQHTTFFFRAHYSLF